MADAPGDKTGPLSADDLRTIWRSAVDRSYSIPLEQAGTGDGLEVYGQAFAQLARVSTAVDRSTQSLFILKHSSQTAPPADGPVNATVTLSFTRTLRIDRPLVLGRGALWIDEAALDAGENGPVAVDTGRRYLLDETLVFLPGEMGPLTVRAVAEKPGAGYNFPRPGTLSILEQVGAGFSNDGGEVDVATTPATIQTLRTQNEADTLVPDQVGAYVGFDAGANIGLEARVLALVPPDPNAESTTFPFGLGSAVTLEALAVVSGTPAGTFVEELVALSGASTGTGRVLAARERADGVFMIAFALSSGTVTIGTVITGGTSGATLTVDRLFRDGQLTPETPTAGVGGASWRVLSWADDWGLTSTNEASPVNGQAGMIDLLGTDRGLPRSPGESVEPYRKRVSTIADVVSPNAIRRALFRVMGTFPWCFREVSTSKLPGFFYDREDDAGDAWDFDSLLWAGSAVGTFIDHEPVTYVNAGGDKLAGGYYGGVASDSSFVLVRRFGSAIVPSAGDTIVGATSGAVFTPTASVANPSAQATRYRVWLDYAEMRAFFLVNVPTLGLGEFGFAYDDTPYGAYDATPSDFYDGSPVEDFALYGRVYAALEAARAGGVLTDLERSSGACA